jgi:NADPH-dependent ferric siderophore reductase
MRRITVQADGVADVAIKPAQDVELLLRDSTGRRVKRRYTIRHARPEAAELDLDVLLHGDGPGASWGARAQQGDNVEFQGPRGKLELRSAPVHLVVGDESALPAIAAICDALPDGERAIAVIEIRDVADQLPVDAEVHWVARGGTPPGGADLLGAALGHVEIAADARAYLMGETRAMVALRGVVEARGIAHEAVFVKGYWNLGRDQRIGSG